MAGDGEGGGFVGGAVITGEEIEAVAAGGEWGKAEGTIGEVEEVAAGDEARVGFEEGDVADVAGGWAGRIGGGEAGNFAQEEVEFAAFTGEAGLEDLIGGAFGVGTAGGVIAAGEG
jgi:hypothetical protein